MIPLLWKCFYDANAYNSVLKTWKFKTAIYFFFISFIASFLADLSSIPYLHKFLSEEAQTISSQIPNCRITENGIDLAGESPVYVKLSNGKDFMGFTSGFIPPEKLESLMFAFEKDWISFNLNGGFEKRVPYSEILQYYKSVYPEKTEIAVNSDSALDFIAYLKTVLIFAFPVFNFAFAIMSSALMLLSVAIPAYILSSKLMPDIKFSGALKIALIASTPAIILSAAGGILTNMGSFVFAMLSFAIVWKMTRRIAVLRLQEMKQSLGGGSD